MQCQPLALRERLSGQGPQYQELKVLKNIHSSHMDQWMYSPKCRQVWVENTEALCSWLSHMHLQTKETLGGSFLSENNHF